MRIAICPGSFDPITLGHLDIIRRASLLFDLVIVAVTVNHNKTPSFSVEERVELVRRCTESFSNVQADCCDGLLADYAKEKNACALVKGLRAVTDFEYEFQMALINKQLNPELETVFMTTSSAYMYLSSSAVRQVAGYGGDVSQFVPPQILEDVVSRFSAERSQNNERECKRPTQHD